VFFFIDMSLTRKAIALDAKKVTVATCCNL
jgi:hypothetical protein